MDFAQIVLVSILVEAIWENCKMVWKDKKINVNMLGALILSIVICLTANINIFNIIGIELSIPYLGGFLTGIIVSRGANFVNDLFTKLQGGK